MTNMTNITQVRVDLRALARRMSARIFGVEPDRTPFDEAFAMFAALGASVAGSLDASARLARVGNLGGSVV
jgi:hypothetical protein